MAKFLLGLFGGLSILNGFVTIALGLQSKDEYALAISLWVGAGFLLAGAPLLGFARVITLLEKIDASAEKSLTATLMQNKSLSTGSLTPSSVPPHSTEQRFPW